MNSIYRRFSLQGRLALITGGAGLLGLKHAEAISSAGGIPIIVDIPKTEPKKVAIQLSKKWKVPVYGYDLDITNP